MMNAAITDSLQISGVCFNEDGSPKGAVNMRVGERLDTSEAIKRISSVRSVRMELRRVL